MVRDPWSSPPPFPGVNAVAQAVDAVDRQRRRLERDLHDGVQQRLVALSIRLALARELATGDELLSELLGELGERADAAIEELRELAQGIHPHVLSDHGIDAALRQIARTAGCPVSVRSRGVGRQPAEVEAAIYYCCREAIQNASKHGGPTVQIAISLHEDKRTVGFAVSDDGPGFDLAELAAGAGLQHMRDRIAAVGGELSILTQIGGGTVVTGTVPRW